MNPYQWRADNLRQLGFSTYEAYLKSALWASIRDRVFERAQHKCRRCRARATQVHYRAYDLATLQGTCLDALDAVCADCHRQAERPARHQSGVDRLSRANAFLLTRKHRRRRRGRRQKHPVVPMVSLPPELYAPIWHRVEEFK